MNTKIILTVPKRVAIGTFLVLATIFGCNSFTETDLPATQLYADAVFEDRNTANAALADIYARMRESGLISGKATGIGYRMGLYADELSYGGMNATETVFFTNNLLPATAELRVMWNSAYSRVYAANAIVEGVAASASLAEQDKKQLTGEALFIRALEHFYINQLWGEVPYIVTTDYRINSTVTRTPQAEFFALLIDDLQQASTLLSEEYVDSERVRPNALTAKALLARIYLYNEQWALAADQASAVINATSLYTLDTDINQVFLKDSPATIWQLKPRAEGLNTDEGSAFIFFTVPPSISLNPALVESFEPGDLRRQLWVQGIGNGEGMWYHAYKYKENTNTGSSLEYSKVLRLAELYLIRAEARARQGELVSALDDLNTIRHIAGLPDSPASTQPEILMAILSERRVELFTEYGHRFADLRRFGMLDTVLSTAKDGWDSHDRLLPVPEAELGLNPNLLPQNTGY